MIINLTKHKTAWLLTAVLSLVSALYGVFKPGVYSSVASTDVMTGVLSQDLISIIASLVAIILTVLIKEGDYKKQIVVIGILGFFFYAYGIYVIEQFYNVLYFVYMAIFALSFFSIVYGVANIRREILAKVRVSKPIRNIAVGFSLFIPVLFYPIWTSQLIPLLREGRKLEFMYSVYILDMCFIFPAFIIIALMAIKNKGLGLLLLPTLFINGFTLIFSVALGGIIKHLYYQAGGGDIWLYLGISLVFLLLSLLYFVNLKIESKLV